MEQFLEVMRPLVEITEALGAQKWVTVSTIRPLLHQLFNKFLKSMPSESRLAKLRKQKMQHNLINQYIGSIVDLLNVATFLDPRFRTLKFLGEEKDEVVRKVTEEASTLSSPLLFDTSAESTDGRSLEPPQSKVPCWGKNSFIYWKMLVLKYQKIPLLKEPSKKSRDMKVKIKRVTVIHWNGGNLQVEDILFFPSWQGSIYL